MQRSSPVPGGLGSPSCGKFQPRKCGVGDRGVPAVRHIPDWIPRKKQSHQASLEMPKSLEGLKVREVLERLVEKTVAGGIEKTKRKSSL